MLFFRFIVYIQEKEMVQDFDFTIIYINIGS